jgi:hypothetical protein
MVFPQFGLRQHASDYALSLAADAVARETSNAWDRAVGTEVAAAVPCASPPGHRGGGKAFSRAMAEVGRCAVAPAMFRRRERRAEGPSLALYEWFTCTSGAGGSFHFLGPTAGW